MARAFVCLARNDLDENLLQLLDLVPNTSLRNFPYTAAGQTGYVSDFVQNELPVLFNNGGVLEADGTVYGLAAYLLDNVEVDATGQLMSAANSATIATAIITRVIGGLSLTLADINTAIATTLVGSDLDGAGTNSTGTVEEVLRILSGESYRILDGVSISGAAGVFAVARAGFFTTAPVQIRPSNGPGGRSITAAPVVPVGTIPQTTVATVRNLGQGVTYSVPATADLTFRDIRVLVDTPDLHRSCLNGRLSALKATTFAFENPSFTYGAGGTATTASGTAISATTFAARAVTVYKADGNLI